jgi:hypothetical protein
MKNRKMVKCDKCGKDFRSDNLKRHLKSHEKNSKMTIRKEKAI